jgi:hypothetical protein
MKNKQLVCSLDSFFLAVLQHHGPPNIDARHYLHDRFNHGTGAYLKHTEHGKLFMEDISIGIATAISGEKTNVPGFNCDKSC